MTGETVRQLITRLSGNILFVSLYAGAWLFALCFIYFIWEAQMKFKIIAIIPLIFLSPSLDDLAVAWKNWRQGRAGVGKVVPPD
jgi:hypothetical protein